MANIVVVDDDDMVRKTLTTVLGLAGHAVREAAGGRAGLTLVQAEPPELLVTDLNMPGMDGAGFIRAARDLCPTIRVIAITGSAAKARDDPLAAEAAGADATLGKPVRRADLLACIDELLRDRGAGY